jgi:hypothetical protein
MARVQAYSSHRHLRLARCCCAAVQQRRRRQREQQSGRATTASDASSVSMRWQRAGAAAAFGPAACSRGAAIARVLTSGVLLLLLVPCLCRRKFKGAIRMPNVGYGTNKKDRHVLPNGFKKVRSSSHQQWGATESAPTYRQQHAAPGVCARDGGGGGFCALPCRQQSCGTQLVRVACAVGWRVGGGAAPCLLNACCVSLLLLPPPLHSGAGAQRGRPGDAADAQPHVLRRGEP